MTLVRESEAIGRPTQALPILASCKQSWSLSSAGSYRSAVSVRAPWWSRPWWSSSYPALTWAWTTSAGAASPGDWRAAGSASNEAGHRSEVRGAVGQGRGGGGSVSHLSLVSNKEGEGKESDTHGCVYACTHACTLTHARTHLWKGPHYDTHTQTLTHTISESVVLQVIINLWSNEWLVSGTVPLKSNSTNHTKTLIKGVKGVGV